MMKGHGNGHDDVHSAGTDAQRGNSRMGHSESDSQPLSDRRDIRNAALIIIAVLVLHCCGVIRAVECVDIDGADEAAHRREGRLR